MDAEPPNAGTTKPGEDEVECYSCAGCDGDVPMTDALWFPHPLSVAKHLRDTSISLAKPYCCQECWRGNPHVLL